MPETIGLSVDSATSAPPAGAGPFKLTVPVEEVPPVTLAGLTETAESTGGLIVRVVFWVPLKLPVMVAEVTAPTALVFTENVAVVSPAATVTLAGTVAAALPLDSATTAPLAGAGPFRVTVPVEDSPPVTLAGLTETAASAGGLIVRGVFCVPFTLPVMVAEVTAPTALVFTENVAVVSPAATVTLAGSVAAALLLDSATSAPPAGAGPLKVTVPVEDSPPATLAGLTETAASA